MAHRRGSGKTIDTVHWTGFLANIASLATGGTVAVTLLVAQHLPETLLRIRGEWNAFMEATLANASGARITGGIIQVPEGTGTTVLWSPETDADAPWIWWDVMNLSYIEYVTDAVQAVASSSGRRVIDSKAMRKIRNTELQLVVENSDPGTLTGVGGNVLLAGRALYGS